MTLFVDSELTVYEFKSTYDLDMSKAFAECMDKQLTQFFEQKTGLKASKNVSISMIRREWEFYKKVDVISEFPIQIYINHHWNSGIVIKWKSKSGRVYDFTDVDIDYNDIEFWFEGLDANLYHKQLYPKEELPFKLKDLSYKLVVERLNIDCEFELVLKQNAYNNSELDQIIKTFDDEIANFNLKSESKNRQYGIVHNWNFSIENQNCIVGLMDMGSAGLVFLKKWLSFLSKTNLLDSVTIK